MAAGLLSVEEERYGAARKYLQHSLKLTPDNDQIRLYLGQIAEEQKKYEEAAKWYREITDSDKVFTAKLHLANTVAQLQGVDAALKQLDSVQPNDEDEFVRLALTKELILRDAHDLPRAKSVMDDAVARYPENTDLLYARGLLAAQLDDISEHEKDMRAVLAEDPNNAQALNALGYTLADATDRFKEAYDLISKALSMRPDDPFILDSMGWVQYRMGNRQDAIEYLQKALAKRDDPEIAAHLGEVLWVAGQKDKAREIWAKAKKEDPDNDTLNETIERLTK
jgi:tetratricopeptide (TPR) repeat protein